MSLIPFVKPEHAELARTIEKKLLDLDKSSGILFVGVAVTPTMVGEEPAFNIWVGCDRSMEEDTISKLVFLTLSSDIVAGAHVQVGAHRGQIRD